MRQRAGLMSAFVFTAAVAALLTMATALSVTDFLQLIFPEIGGVGLKAEASPIERLLGGVYERLAAAGPSRALVLYSLLLLVVYGLKNIFSYLSAVIFARVRIGIVGEIRNGIHRSLLQQPFAGWGAQQQGQWLSKMSNDVAEYEVNVLDSIRMIVSSSLTMAIYVVMLLYLDWRLTLLVVAVMAVGTALLSVSRRLKRQSRQLQKLNGELMSTTQETIDSLKEIKAATAIDYVNEKQRAQNAAFTKRRISIYRKINAASPVSDFVGNVIVVAILIIGAYRVLGAEASLSPALFVSYIMIYVLLLTPIKDFSNGIAQLKKGRGVEDNVAGSLVDDALAAGRPSVEPVRSIELRDATFGYGDVKVLDAVSWVVPMGQHTAVVGESGSGKTTLGRLIAGLVDADSGAVLVNGKPTTAAERAGRIAYIAQEPMLFNDTVEENIRFGREWISDDDVRQAVAMAQADGIVAALPEGLKSSIGDGGGRLSGGERQRIGIARALAGAPDVVIMDEATAALDAATENGLMHAVRDCLKGHTVIVIAHRASTIAECDGVFNVAKYRH